MDILIVGAGTMGRWFGSTVTGAITYVDVDSTAAEQAAANIGGSATTPSVIDQSFDLVCIAVPMSAATQAIQQYGQYAEKAIIDVTGSMTEPIDMMRQVCPEAQRASYHPLFAPENAPGSIPAVIDEPGSVIATVDRWFRNRGNHIVETTPAEHDQAMESIQAAAHTAVIAYGIAVERVPEGFQTPVSAELDRLVEQVANGEPSVYAEIQKQFTGADRVAAAAAELAAADPEQFTELYHKAKPALPTHRE